MYEIECGGVLADQIRIQKQGAENGPLSLCEVVVYGDSTQGNETLQKISSVLLYLTLFHVTPPALCSRLFALRAHAYRE